MNIDSLRDEIMNGPQRAGGKRLRLAVDFDSTIHDPYNRLPRYKMGQPVKDVVESIKQLRSEGHEIIVFPTWADTAPKRQAIVDWLAYFNIAYDDITSQKPDADVYLDNRGLRFVDWKTALSDIRRLAC